MTPVLLGHGFRTNLGYRITQSSNTPCFSLADVLTIEKTNDHFRLLYDVKGRFVLHKIGAEEASYKLLRVKRVAVGPKGVPYLVTHDGRTIRYPDPLIKVHDTVRYDLNKGKIVDFIKFETGNLCMVTGGHNLGRVGVITSRERHPGSFDIVHVRDSLGHSFATRLVFYCFTFDASTLPDETYLPSMSLPMLTTISLSECVCFHFLPPSFLHDDLYHFSSSLYRLNYIFVIGKSTKPYISLPKGKGVRLTAAEERDKRLAAKSQ